MPNIIFSESSNLNGSIYGKSEAPIKMFLEQRAEAHEAKSLLKHLFSMDKSENWAEKYTSMTAMDGFVPVKEGDAHPMDGFQESYSKLLEHVTWKDAFSITREIMDDGKLMDLKKRPQAFITGYYRTREQFGAAIYAGAIAGAKKINFKGMDFDVTCADGHGAFDTKHPSILGKGTQSNRFSDELSADSLAAAETEMQNFTGDNGEILDIAPGTILVANDYQLKKKAFEIVGADKDPNTANNGFNYLFGRWRIIVSPWLTRMLAKGLKPWMLLDSEYNDNYGGAVWLDRVNLEVGSRIDRNTQNCIWDGYARFVAGFNDWRFACLGGVPDGTKLVAG